MDASARYAVPVSPFASDAATVFHRPYRWAAPAVTPSVRRCQCSAPVVSEASSARRYRRAAPVLRPSRPRQREPELRSFFALLSCSARKPGALPPWRARSPGRAFTGCSPLPRLTPAPAGGRYFPVPAPFGLAPRAGRGSASRSASTLARVAGDSPLRSARELRKSPCPDTGEPRVASCPQPAPVQAGGDCRSGRRRSPAARRRGNRARRGSAEDPVNLPPAERVRHGGRTPGFLREAGKRQRTKARRAAGRKPRRVSRRPGAEAWTGARE